jgi:hypothetical protein
MLRTTTIGRLIAVCSPLALAACGVSTPEMTVQNESVPIPPSYGLYAYNGDNLIRLDGSGDWERSTWADRSSLPPKVEFIVFEPALATDATSLQNLIQLRRVAHVRNQVSANGQVAPAQTTRWGAPDLPDYRITMTYTPAPGRPDLLVAKPSDELAAGLYSFSLQTKPQAINARIGIGWPDVNQTEYAAAHCVDSYPSGYRRCSDSDARANDPAAGVAQAAGLAPATMPVAAPTYGGTYGGTTAATTIGSAGAAAPDTSAPLANLTVRGLRSSRLTVAGSQALVVEGDIVNTSPAPRVIPSRFVLSLIGSNGAVLEQIAIADLPPTILSPTEVYHFRTEVPNPPADAVRIRLAPAG